jgi:hypothetical protein
MQDKNQPRMFLCENGTTAEIFDMIPFSEMDETDEERENNPLCIKLTDEEWPLSDEIILDKLKKFILFNAVKNNTTSNKYLYVKPIYK